MAAQLVLIAYDGSPGAAHAIEGAGSLFSGRSARVLCVWSPILAAAPVVGGVPIYLSDLEPRITEKARETAEEGARLAREAGFDAETLTESENPTWLAIVKMAEMLDAGVIVVGARGLSGFKSALLGSTSNGVLNHTTRPVLVVHDAPGEHES